MQDDKKFYIFLELVKAIEEKIEYGDLSKKNIEDIKKNIEDINLNVIRLILRNSEK